MFHHCTEEVFQTRAIGLPLEERTSIQVDGERSVKVVLIEVALSRPGGAVEVDTKAGGGTTNLQLLQVSLLYRMTCILKHMVQ